MANLFELTPKERFLAMLAAVLADLDGLGGAVSQDLYWRFHHSVGHNIFYGLLLSAVCAAFASHRLKMFLLAFALFHLHLLMDLFGSGELWGIAYFWPLQREEFLLPTSWTWQFFSWQNFLAGALLLIWTLAIAVRKGRTPLEYVLPAADPKIAGAVTRLLSRNRRTK